MARDRSLDGLRGLAAVNVAVFHFCCAFAPRFVPEYHRVDPWPGADTPLAVLYNGGFAVAMFFMLSGFVLSKSAASSKRTLPFSVMQRYVRLAGPVIASTLLAWVLLTIMPDAASTLRTLVDSQWLEYVYQRDLPGLAAALYHGAAGLFLEGNSFFNNALWTMRIELLGSCLIYVIYQRALVHVRTALSCGALAGAVLVSRPDHGAFALGALLQEAWAARTLPSRWPKAALMVGLILGAMMPGYASRVLSFNDAVLPRQFRLGEPHGFWQVLAAAMIMYAILNLPALRRVLSAPVPRFLGRISFGFYLVHVPLLYTVIAATYLRLPAAGLTTFGLFAGLSLLAGYVFTVVVDEPILRLLRSIARQRASTSSEYPPNTLTARSRSSE